MDTDSQFTVLTRNKQLNEVKELGKGTNMLLKQVTKLDLQIW
mgnify:CR=1 FL=1